MQLVMVLYRKLLTTGTQLPTFQHNVWGLNLGGGRCVTATPIPQSCKLNTWYICQRYYYKNSIRDARTPQSGETVFNTITYKSSETVQRLGYCQSSVSYIRVQIMFK